LNVSLQDSLSTTGFFVALFQRRQNKNQRQATIDPIKSLVVDFKLQSGKAEYIIGIKVLDIDSGIDLSCKY